uniref:Uncharacterized protein n=1 Tax=Faecalibaculum rodentium TaxID=1702221 RepID=A0A140DTJ8_9FIRM|nr:hypothetical protein AALO17_08410 [Faecalibaculum rodentium]
MQTLFPLAGYGILIQELTAEPGSVVQSVRNILRGVWL